MDAPRLTATYSTRVILHRWVNLRLEHLDEIEGTKSAPRGRASGAYDVGWYLP